MSGQSDRPDSDPRRSARPDSDPRRSAGSARPDSDPRRSARPDSDPETERLPTAGGGGGDAERRRAEAIAVLDEPLDDEDLGERLRRPGLARSTRILLVALGAVLVFGLGALLGRATAPDTGPGSAPDVVGVVESVGPAGPGGARQLTVRTADGGMTVLEAGTGTRVGVPTPEGLEGLAPGAPVTVTAQRNQLGGLDATHVALTDGP